MVPKNTSLVEPIGHQWEIVQGCYKNVFDTRCFHHQMLQDITVNSFFGAKQ